MKKIFKNKKVLLIVIVIILFFFLTKDRQKELSYKVSGNELLEIKEKCNNLAHAKLDEFNSYGLGFHTLDGYGYSEFRGICYAEFIRKHSNDFSFQIIKFIKYLLRPRPS